MPIIRILFLLMAGGLLYASLLHLASGSGAPRDRRHLLLAATCLATAAVVASVTWSYVATTPAAMAVTHRVFIACVVPALLALLWFFATFSPGNQPRFLLPMSVAAVLFWLLNLASPASLQFAYIEDLEHIRTPWGESIALPRGTIGAWFPIACAWALIVLGYGLVNLWRYWLRSRRTGALAMALATMLFFVAMVQAIAVRLGWADPPHLGLIGFGIMIVAISASFIHDDKQRRRLAEARIRTLAFVDSVTGLGSRAHITDGIDSILQRDIRKAGQTHALLHVDLDNFRTINDALGRTVGDALLAAIATRRMRDAGCGMRDAAEPAMTLGRLGADDFIAIMPLPTSGITNADDAAAATASRLLLVLEPTFEVGNRQIAVGASVGIALFPIEADSAADVLRRAELAVHRAKALGRGRLEFYSTHLGRAADRRLQLEEGLRQAPGTDALRLLYQPKVDADGRQVGMEALIRWRHPQLGVISPEEFIPIAEHSGLIFPLGQWVLETACMQMARWESERPGLMGQLAINISPWQWAQDNLVEQLSAATHRAGIAPSLLKLEITESAALVDLTDTLRKLAALRDLGFKVSLDDFGTGYSSLSQLRNLPVDELKIDKAFVMELDSGTPYPLVGPILAIGRHLKLDVVAEGVETQRQCDQLLALGCRQFQGHLFAEAMCAEDAFAWAERTMRNPV